MATPTPTQQPASGQPTSASKKMNQQHAPATTPAHLSSPAPRSIPSPATVRRDQAGKTPTTHHGQNAQGSSSNSKSLATATAATPMIRNPSFTGTNASSGSPGAGGLLGAGGGFGTPLGLGLDLGGSGGAGGPPTTTTTTTAMGATPLLSSSLGTPGFHAAVDKMLATAGEEGQRKRDVEAERRGNVRRVLGILGTRGDRVGEEGVARVARRVGFENDIDAESLTAEQRERRVGNRAVSIAGNTVVVDVVLREQVPRRVEVIHIGETEALGEHARFAGERLLGDLRGRRGGLGSSLERFAESLEGLARVDRLSSEKVNCFEGITGVYASLRRLWEVERKAVSQGLGDGGEREPRVDAEVLSRRSGRPTFCARGRLGVGIEYWRRPVLDGGEERGKQERGQDVAMRDADQGQEETGSDENKDTYCLRIEAEPLHGELFPPIRISSNWLPESFELPDPASAQGLPWHDPPQTVLNADKQSSDAMNMDPSNQKLPEVRFVAKLDPPITLPLPVAMNVLQAVGANVPNFTQAQPAYHSLVLPGSASSAQSGMPVTTSEQPSFSFANNREETSKHNYNLFVPEATALSYYGYRLESLPFSHPRQLVELLPTLRQWARSEELLKALFPPTTPPTLPPPQPAQSQTTTFGPPKDLSLDSILTPPHNAPDASSSSSIPVTTALPIDVALSTLQSPIITLVLPIGRQRTDTTAVAVQVLPNGVLQVDGGGGGGGGGFDGVKAAKALEACGGEVATWVEWVRCRVLNAGKEEGG
ncbi:hypothetical protein MBLNU230_g4025t1 [Neophaeotheca triangularis]